MQDTLDRSWPGAAVVYYASSARVGPLVGRQSVVLMPSGFFESGRLHIYYVSCTSSKARHLARHNSAQFRNPSLLFSHYALHHCFLGALYIVSHLPFDEESKSSTLSLSLSSSSCTFNIRAPLPPSSLHPAFSTTLPLFCSMKKAGFTTLVHTPFSLFTAKQLRMQMGD